MNHSTFRQIALASALSLAGLAHAGECPADKAAANDLKGAATAPVGVADT